MASTPEIGDVVGDFYPAGGHLDGGTVHRRDSTLCEQRGKPLVLVCPTKAVRWRSPAGTAHP
ncbi:MULTISPECIES: hypothetical protein [unclassified Streptomyces]|uniref:hypothetical protein n=1 Tax=unclassified Streptomyces TaxID=2593676 RepID=UPI0006FAADB9|nr:MULTISPECIES: hypothetical protein [unclassified Streptomyces]KQX56240.1 hypothetical protein ASD33_29760 [Streptomyces sp. Root1304]KRA97056.1 hypothetical protein ASE09_26570 [Streptomyces sp. Root66D1]